MSACQGNISAGDEGSPNVCSRAALLMARTAPHRKYTYIWLPFVHVTQMCSNNNAFAVVLLSIKCYLVL